MRFLAQTIGAVQERFPQVALSFCDGEPQESVLRLKERAIDLAAVFDFDHLTLSTDYDGRTRNRPRGRPGTARRTRSPL